MTVRRAIHAPALQAQGRDRSDAFKQIGAAATVDDGLDGGAHARQACRPSNP